MRERLIGTIARTEGKKMTTKKPEAVILWHIIDNGVDCYLTDDVAGEPSVLDGKKGVWLQLESLEQIVAEAREDARNEWLECINATIAGESKERREDSVYIKKLKVRLGIV